MIKEAEYPSSASSAIPGIADSTMLLNGKKIVVKINPNLSVKHALSAKMDQE